MNRQPPRAERTRSWRGWLIPAALLALAPKCVLCLLAYAGLASALGLAGPELCGAPGNAIGSWPTWLFLFGFIAVVVAVGIFARLLSRRA